jgi:three-Cys-motif partner protein
MDRSVTMGGKSTFFDAKLPPAELKHGILNRYPRIFLAKTGSRVAGGRVVFLDGYAGRGEYGDGQPGSPLVLMQHAKISSRNRKITGLFVESNRENLRHLRQALAVHAEGLDYEIFGEDLSQALPAVLKRAQGAPLFAFLDPFGSAIAADEIAKILGRAAGRSWPPTEVLLHFSVSAVSRYGGALRQRQASGLSSDDDAKLSRVDKFLGGSGWRKDFIEASDKSSAGRAALKVAERFSEHMRKRTGFDAVPMRVYASTTSNVPKYVLLLFTRSAHGIWSFAEVLGHARLDWERACSELEHGKRDLKRESDNGMVPLVGLEAGTIFDEVVYKERIEAECVPQIAANIESLLQRGPFRIIDEVRAVYGSTLGYAWVPHVRKAVRRLHDAGTVINNGRGDFHLEVLRRSNS